LRDEPSSFGAWHQRKLVRASDHGHGYEEPRSRQQQHDAGSYEMSLFFILLGQSIPINASRVKVPVLRAPPEDGIHPTPDRVLTTYQQNPKHRGLSTVSYGPGIDERPSIPAQCRWADLLSRRQLLQLTIYHHTGIREPSQPMTSGFCNHHPRRTSLPGHFRQPSTSSSNIKADQPTFPLTLRTTQPSRATNPLNGTSPATIPRLSSLTGFILQRCTTNA
jgi:hypothetical protein